MILLNVAMGGAQHNGTSTGHLLESGRPEKVLPTVPANEIKIVSYNIRWRSGKELQEIATWLKSTAAPAPTIIGLQEVDRAKKRSGHEHNAKTLAENLGMYYAWAAPNVPKKAKEGAEEETGVAILSSYSLQDITRLVLTTEGPGGRSRVALGATVRIGNTPVRVYSVHAEVRLPMWKKTDQLKLVLDDLAKFPKINAAIVLGDFNIWELPTIDALREIFTKAGFITPIPDDESTFTRKVQGLNMKLKLDWIWVREMTPKAYGIDRRFRVSDHFPLWTDVKLPAG